MSNGDNRQSNANFRRDSRTSDGQAGSVMPSRGDPPQQVQFSSETLQSNFADSSSAGPKSPAVQSASSQASSFVFPVRSVFANVQQSGRGNPSSGPSGQGASLSRMTSNASNVSHRNDRSLSLAATDGAAEEIRAHAESISQMLESASNSKLPQDHSRQHSYLAVESQPPHRSNSDSSGTATEGIYSAPLPRDGEQSASASYFNLKGRRSSDGSTNRRSPNPDAVRPASRSHMAAETSAHAHGQIDPVPQEARAPGLQTTEQCSTNATETKVYRFSDRPGVDRESHQQASTLTSADPPSKVDAPKHRPLRSDASTDNIASGGSKEHDRSGEVTEVYISIPQNHEPTEPDVGPAVDRPTDMTDIVRLPHVGDGSRPNSSAKGTLGRESRNPRPSVNRHQSVDHQQSVRNFVNNQAETVNMSDPNAPTPALRDAGEGEDYTCVVRSRHRSSDDTTQVEDDFGFESPDQGSDSDADANVDGDKVRSDSNNQVGLRDSESQSQVSSDLADEPVMTVRFEHVTTEDGHHVVVGREGKLEKCEDEVRHSSCWSPSSELDYNHCLLSLAHHNPWCCPRVRCPYGT